MYTAFQTAAIRERFQPLAFSVVRVTALALIFYGLFFLI